MEDLVERIGIVLMDDIDDEDVFCADVVSLCNMGYRDETIEALTYIALACRKMERMTENHLEILEKLVVGD